MWNTYAEEYYSAIKRNKLLTNATTKQINLKNFMLCKRISIQKSIYCIISFI